MRNYSSRKGFTLAEVLITLGIIGVVAALTIPTLLNNYQKKVLDNKFKLAYTYLNNAHRSVQGTLGYIPACYYYYNGGGTSVRTGCNEYSKLFLAQFKIIKTCEKAITSGCVPDYKGWDEVKKENNPDLSDEDIMEQMVGCSNLGKSQLKNYPAYLLANGMILMPGVSSTDYIASNTIIDINGIQGPNKWGYDLYYVYLYYDNTKLFVVNNSGCMPLEEGGKYFSARVQELFGHN